MAISWQSYGFREMYKKNYYLISGFILLLILAGFGIINTGCTTISVSTQFVTYSDDVNGFSIDYPENWYKDIHTDSSDLLISIWEKEFGINPVGFIVAKYQASGYSLEEFFEYRENYLIENSEDYSPISTEELTINGTQAMKHFYNHSISVPYKSAEVCLVKNNTGWIINFASPEKSFDTYESIMDTCFNSFTLLD